MTRIFVSSTLKLLRLWHRPIRLTKTIPSFYDAPIVSHSWKLRKTSRKDWHVQWADTGTSTKKLPKVWLRMQNRSWQAVLSASCGRNSKKRKIWDRSIYKVTFKLWLMSSIKTPLKRTNAVKIQQIQEKQRHDQQLPRNLFAWTLPLVLASSRPIRKGTPAKKPRRLRA